MRKVAVLIGAGLVAVLALGASASQIQNGKGGEGPGKLLGSHTVRIETTGKIDFDDVEAPCGFNEAVALQSYGDTAFAGPSDLNGGAILNECGYFSVKGYSSPNFLAFNCGAVLGDGEIPTVSEFVTFSSEVTNLSLKIGSAASPGGLVTFLAYGSEGGQARYVHVGPDMRTVRFSIPVQQLEIWSDNACTLVLDDFSWD
jgi:hypothetical protein